MSNPKFNTMKTRHTSGSWTNDKNSVLIPVYNEKAGAEKVTLCLSSKEGEAEANARLIAAAPELFEALQDIIRGDGNLIATIQKEKALKALYKAQYDYQV